MKKLLFALLACGFVMSSCKKETIETNEVLKSSIETVEIYGVTYKKDSVLNEMSIVTGFSVTDIYFDANNQKFKVKDLEFGEFNPEDYLILKEE